MKLISMTDFVLEQRLKYAESFKSKVYAYANFLKQPLTLGMFIPCDEDGNVLEEPESYGLPVDIHNQGCHITEEHDIYHEAKEGVLFEGYVLIKDTRTTITIYNKYNKEELGFAKNKPSGETIESWLSISFNPPKLTPQALKQIGL